MNRAALTTHFDALDALKIDYNLNAARAQNLTETVFYPGKKTAGTFLNLAFHAIVDIQTYL